MAKTKSENVSNSLTTKSGNLLTTKSENVPNSLTTDDIFNLADLYFYRKNYIFRHLYDSYNKFLEEDVRVFLEDTDHVFNEKMTYDTIYRRKFRFKNVRIVGPKLPNGLEPMFPSDARHRNLTYSVKIIADITQYQEKINIVTDRKTETITGVEEMGVPIASIPLMMRSKYCSLNQYKGNDLNECDFNPGGYFIVNGSEKVVICQERMVENKPLVFLKKDSGIPSHIVQVNSRSYKSNGMMQVLNVKIKADGTMTIRVPILQEVNVFVLFRALGVLSDRDIINTIVPDENDNDMIDILRISLETCKNENHQTIQTSEEAYDYLINKLRVIRKYTETNTEIKIMQKKMHLLHLLKTSFIPHIGEGFKEKAYYLAYMINKLLKVYLGRTKVDDRDSYVNKRVDLPGDLLMELFRQRFKIMMSDCKKFFDNRNDNDDRPLNIINQIKPNTIEQGIKASLLTGAWIRKKGVAQMLQCYSYLQILGFLRRIDSPAGDASSSKLVGPRQLHPSSIPFLCVVQTPEHAKVGVTKHFSLISSATIMSLDQYRMLKTLVAKKIKNLRDLSIQEIRNMFKVFLNGEWMGCIQEPNAFVAELREMKSKNLIDRQNTSIVPDYFNGEIRIYCETGRFIRPVLCVENNVIKVTKEIIDKISLNKADKQTKITSWEELLDKYPDIIEYVDTETQPYYMFKTKVKEVEEMRVKMVESVKLAKNVADKISSNRYNELYFDVINYCEIHPQLLLGELSACTPFSNRNPGPRNIFQYSQGRQAMGIYLTNYRDRTDISYILYMPQKPLITTRATKYVGSDILASGENIMVGIACYTGYNMEDSLIFNSASVDRGLFRSATYKKYVSKAQKNQSTAQDDIFMKPDSTKVVGMRHGSYDKLNDKGYVPLETVVNNDDIIIGKVTPIQNIGNSNKEFKDASEVYKAGAPGVIDRVYIDIQDQDGFPTRKVLVRSTRTPKVGDKFACYTPDHDVLTTDGWITIDKLTTTHKVACLVDGKKLKYINPTEVQSFDCDEEIYVVESNQVNLKVTKNHRMYVSPTDICKYKIENAEDIYHKERKYLKICESMECDDQQVQNTFYTDTNKFGDIMLDDFMKHYYFHKYFPEWTWELNSRQCKYLVDGIILGNICENNTSNENGIFNTIKNGILTTIKNGIFNTINNMIFGTNNTTKEYITFSESLAGDLQKLCLHAGYSANINVIYEKDNESTEKSDKTIKYSLSIETKNNSVVNENNICDKYEHYAGKVYCCTVPTEDGVIYVRRKGVPVWCGNSRYGQKGTCGIKLQGIDMPYNKYGIRPDIILNPNAIPSRQTIGQLLEELVGKLAALEGFEGDGTAFEDYDVEKIEKRLEELGYDPKGYEELYNGMTGEKLKIKIYVGPTFYQRLKHQVEDKIHARARGPRTLLTRQPPEGRSRDGGLRLGEMERDALIAHGLGKFLNEKMMYNSDAYATYVCDICGLFAQRAPRKENKTEPSPTDIYMCPNCNNVNKISKIMIPYAFKLLLQELVAMSVAPRIRTKKNQSV